MPKGPAGGPLGLWARPAGGPWKWASAAALAAALVFVLVDQPSDPGFRRGHRGWVSAHTLAIIQRATPANGLVGYTLAFVSGGGEAGVPGEPGELARRYEQGELARRYEQGEQARRYELDYFDRYPVFFSAGMHALLHTRSLTLSQQVNLARQAMNLIYVLTLVAAAALMVELGAGVPGAVAAAAMGGSTYYMTEYRDMVHFDQPALLGCVALLWAIACWSRGAPSRRLYAVTAVAVLMGRGYASFAVLGVWWLLESGAALRSAGLGAVSAIARSTPTRACILSIALGGSCLAYNIAVEAHVRGVPITEVGIVQSATRRLALDPEFNRRKASLVSGTSFFANQSESFVRSLIPWRKHRPFRHGGNAVPAAAALILLGVVVFAATRRRPLKIPYLVAALSGPTWMIAMRDLTAFHHYTTIYLFPVGLLVFTALLAALPRRVHGAAALAACALLVVCTQAKNRYVADKGRTGAVDTADMQWVAARLRPDDAVAVLPNYRSLISGAPFAIGFYLPEQFVVSDGAADLVLTRKDNFRGENLTPNNRRLFLYRLPRPFSVQPLSERRKHASRSSS